MSLKPAQSRAARVWLNWTQAELAKQAKIGLSTLRGFEAGTRTPINNNVAAIRRALEDGGATAFLNAVDALDPQAAPDQNSATLWEWGQGIPKTINGTSVRQRSIHLAAAMGVAIPDTLPVLDQMALTKSEDAVIERLLCLHVVGACSYGFDRQRALEWVGREQLNRALTEQELRFLKVGDADRKRFQRSIEGLWALCWSLGLAPVLDFSSGCPQDLFFLMPNLNEAQSSSPLRSRAKLRTGDEIVSAADLAYCLRWAVRDALLTRTTTGMLAKPFVIVERRRALEWLVSNEAWDAIDLDV